MNTDFILPLHFKNITQSTQDFSDEEFGAYVRLLIYQWDKGFIPSEMNRLNRIAESCERNWNVLSQKFEKQESGLLKNKRMERIRDEKADYQHKRSLAGKASATKRQQNANKDLTNDEHNGQHKPNIVGEGEGEGLSNGESEKKTPFEPTETSLSCEMRKSWLKLMPQYPQEDERDLKALVRISYFVRNQMKEHKQNGDPYFKVLIHDHEILGLWEVLAGTAASDKFWKTKSLDSISTHIQEIWQKTNKNGTREQQLKQTFSELDQKIDEFYANKHG